jgi:hypothetical protein
VLVERHSAPRIRGIQREYARSSKLLALVGALATFSSARSASADPLRLRGDALVESRSPVGLLVLRGEDRFQPGVDAEAVAGLGLGETSGDVQTMTIRLRDPAGRAELRVGRFVFTAGAIRPLQLDGARALVRAPTGTSLETFVGSPVQRAYDVSYSARAAQRIGELLTLGGAYLVQRRGGSIADQEIGPDFMFAPARWLDMVGRMAFDLRDPGIVDALASAAARTSKASSLDLRFEVFATHRSPGRLLPATSLFSVLGDLPSTTSGGTVRWRAAPRLDLLVTGAAVHTGTTGGMGTVRATLALDDDEAFNGGNVGLELRRQDVAEAKWTGVRVLGSVPLSPAIRVGAELEVVRPDVPVGTSRVWPWALVSCGYRASESWTFAAAAEGMRTRDDRNELHAMLRATWAR